MCSSDLDGHALYSSADHRALLVCRPPFGHRPARDVVYVYDLGATMGGYRGGYTGGLMQAVVTGILAGENAARR